MEWRPGFLYSIKQCGEPGAVDRAILRPGICLVARWCLDLFVIVQNLQRICAVILVLSVINRRLE
jgi:hypothetical protein